MGCESGGGSSDDDKDVASAEDVGGAEDMTTGEDIPAEEDLAVEGDVSPVEDDVAAVDEYTGPPDEEDPTVEWEPVPYSAFAGETTIDATWSDNVGVTSIVVLVDGESGGSVNPETKVMNTGHAASGLRELVLQVSDAAGNTVETTPVLAMLAGEGTFLEFTDSFQLPLIPGWGGHQQTVFDFATEVEDAKAHVQMPEGMTKVIAYMKWENETEWDLGLDIGTGTCPHQGKKLAFQDLKAAEGYIALEYEDDGNDLPATTWFAHIRFTDGLEHKGESIIFNVLMLALP